MIYTPSLRRIINVNRMSLTPARACPDKEFHTLEALARAAGVPLTPDLQHEASVTADYPFGEPGFWYEREPGKPY